MKIWRVWEDCHGVVSHWTTEQAAQEEVRQILLNGFDELDPSKTYQQMMDMGFDDCAGYEEIELDKSWL